MATNNQRWVGNIDGATEPYIYLGSFQAGATQAIKQGEILEFTGDSNTDWVPIDSDFAMAGNVAVANEEIKDGDRAGYYEIIVPRPGDMFDYSLATAAATAYGTALYYSSSEAVAASCTNQLATAVGQQHYPQKQEHLADGGIADMGTTIKSQSTVIMTFELAASLYATLVVTA